MNVYIRIEVKDVTIPSIIEILEVTKDYHSSDQFEFTIENERSKKAQEPSNV